MRSLLDKTQHKNLSFKTKKQRFFSMIEKDVRQMEFAGSDIITNIGLFHDDPKELRNNITHLKCISYGKSMFIDWATNLVYLSLDHDFCVIDINFDSFPNLHTLSISRNLLEDYKLLSLPINLKVLIIKNDKLLKNDNTYNYKVYNLPVGLEKIIFVLYYSSEDEYEESLVPILKLLKKPFDCEIYVGNKVTDELDEITNKEFDEIDSITNEQLENARY
jgi:hypothetical protein